MSFPLSSKDPGETQFIHGKGLASSAKQRESRSEALEAAWPYDKAPEGPFGPDVYQEAKAIQRTDPAEANAVPDMKAAPFSVNNRTGTQWTRDS